MAMLGRKYFTLCFLCFFLLFGLYAQQPRDITAYRLANGEHINLDGRIDESFWAKVHAATAFRQQEPLEGQLATEQTSVQIAFDEKNLYIGARFYDSQPDEIKAFRKDGMPHWTPTISLHLFLTPTMTNAPPFILKSIPMGLWEMGF